MVNSGEASPTLYFLSFYANGFVLWIHVIVWSLCPYAKCRLWLFLSWIVNICVCAVCGNQGSLNNSVEQIRSSNTYIPMWSCWATRQNYSAVVTRIKCVNWTSPVITVKVCINCVEPTDTLTNMFTLYIFPEIDHRLANLQEKLLSSTQYAKQKQSLKDELQDFLYALPSEKTLFTALPVDLCRFLIFKDAWVNLSFIPRLVPAGAFQAAAIRNICRYVWHCWLLHRQVKIHHFRRW